MFTYIFQMISSGHESMHSFPSMHSLAKASPATSFIAETFITAEQVNRTFLHCASLIVEEMDGPLINSVALLETMSGVLFN